MVFDAHTHAWARWPYQPVLADREHRGSAEAVLRELDVAGVERAVIVCARIGTERAETDNGDNNSYAAEQVRRHPDRFAMFADVESFWTPEYGTPGSAARLRATVGELGPDGISVYLAEQDDGWLGTSDALEFFGTAAELGLPVSLGAKPALQAGIRGIALAFPGLALLVNHMGDARPASASFDADLALVVANADLPNLTLKISGFPRMSSRRWGFPYSDAIESVLRPVLAAYGSDRLVWGSDWPYVRDDMTYRQALMTVAEADLGLDQSQLEGVLGGNLARLLQRTA